MSKKNLLKAIYGSDKTPLRLGEIEIPCYVLEDGTRVFSGRAIQKALGANPKASGTWLNKFINDSPITEYLYPGVLDQLNNPIVFQRPNASGSQSDTYGYEVTLLIDICTSIIDSYKSRKLKDENIYTNAELIVRSVAKVGIIALVDEATGYQYDRERFELQKILNSYIADEILKWQLTFTDDFYKEMYRLWGLPFIPKYIINKPSFVGGITKKYIYEMLPKGVLDKIIEKTGKTEKGNWRYQWHRNLTPEIGREHLRKQIIEVTTLMSISQTKAQFDTLFQQKYNKQPIQLQIEFDEEPKPAKKLSDFNEKLKKGLGFDPNAEK